MTRSAIGTLIVALACSICVGADPSEPTGSSEPGGFQKELVSRCERAMELQQKGRFSDAAREYEAALRLAERELWKGDPTIGVLHVRLGSLQKEQGQLANAERHLTQGLEILEDRLGRDHLQVASALTALGDVHLLSEEHEKALPLYSRSLKTLRAKLPHDHPLVTYTINNLAAAHTGLGQFEDAETLHLENLRMREASLGKEHPHVLTTLGHLGVLYCNMLRWSDAIPPLQTWLERSKGGQRRERREYNNILLSLGEAHSQLGDYAEAEEYLGKLLETYESDPATDDLAKARVYCDLSFVYLANTPSDLDRAELLAKQSIEIREARLGRDHPETARGLCVLADVYLKAEEFADAEPPLREGIATLEESLGKDAPEVALQLTSLFRLCFKTDRPAEAESVWLRCAEILQREPGRYQRRLIQLVIPALAEVYNRLGNPVEGEARLTETLAALEARLDEEHPDFAEALTMAGLACDEMGRYAQAKAYSERSLALRRATLGNEHPEVAETLERLGKTYLRTARYAEAEPLYLECLRIRREALGTEHPLYFRCLADLGFIYQRMKRYAEAEESYRQSLELAEKHQMPQIADVAASYWGRLCLETGRFDAAEDLLRKGLALAEKHRSKDSPDLAWSLIYLAQLYTQTGRHPEAEPLFRRAVGILETSLGKSHPATQSAASELGNVCMVMGRDGEAREWLERSAEAMRSVPEGNERDLVCTLERLAMLCLKQGERQQALRYCTEARQVARRRMVHVLPGLSPEEQLVYLGMTEKESLAACLAIGMQLASDEEAVRASAEWLINGKAMSSEFVAEGIRLARASSDPEVAEVIEQLAGVRERLARFTLNPGEVSDDSRDSADALALAERERGLARKLGQLTHADYRVSQWVTLEAFRRALPSKTIYVDVTKFRPRRLWSRLHYVAWLIPPEDGGEVQLIDFGDAAKIDAAIAESRLAMEISPQAIPAVGLERSMELAFTASRKLAALIWRPIEARVADADALLVSPEGGLWLFPWEALPVAENRFLIEEKRISYVVSGREILADAGSPSGSEAVVFASPNYDLDLSDSAGTKEEETRWTALAKSSLQGEEEAGLLAGAHLERLPEDADRAAAIASSLERYLGTAPRVLAENDALETSFKTMESPRVVVVSTHGYFLSDQAFDRMPLTDEAKKIWRRFDAWRRLAPENRDVLLIPNPLLRCGLGLAGANRHRHAPGPNDGILTGLEIVGVDLQGTELVVLNACETGVGAVRHGEGTAGLHHAFRLAGAQTVVATLWAVPVQPSTEVMATFLDNLAGNQSKADALCSAKRTLIQDLRKKMGLAHPWLWAGFILSGDWR